MDVWAGFFRITALLSMALVLSAAALVADGSAQQSAGNVTDSGSGDLPLYFIIDSTLGVHEQDIRDGIFEYKLQAAKDNPAMQAALIQSRYDELKSEVKNKKGLLGMLLARNDVIREDRLVAMAREINASIEKLDGRSRKLEERAAGLDAPNGKKDYMGSIAPLMSDLSDVRGMVAAKSQKAYNTGPSGNGNRR